MHNEQWTVLAAYYPPHHVGGREVSDHWIMREAVRSGVQVTVWCEARETKEYVYEGVVVRCSPLARQRFYEDCKRRLNRVFLSGPVTVAPWRLPPATRPVLLLCGKPYLPLVRQLAPVLDTIVVPSTYFKEVVSEYQPTFPRDQIVVSYPNLPRIETLPHRNPRFLTLVSAQRHKGRDLFLALATATPQHDFLVADSMHPFEVESIRLARFDFANLFVSTRHSDMRQIYFITNVLLAPSVPSLHIETFGKAIAEALLHGVPALTYAVGAPLEYLDERLFVPRDDNSLEGQVIAWQEKIAWCEANPVELADAVRRSAERLRALQLPQQAALLITRLRDNA